LSQSILSAPSVAKSPCAAPKCQASSKNALRSGFRSAATNVPIFFRSDASFLFAALAGPLLSVQFRPRKPSHDQGKTVKPTQENIGCDGYEFQYPEEMFGPCFQNR